MPKWKSAATASESDSDERLLEAHIAGHSLAFRWLFERYASRIFAVMLQRGLSEADAQDIVQQTFLRAHQARRDFKVGMQVRPWLWTIAFNLMRDSFRRRGAARSARQSMTEVQLVQSREQAMAPEHAHAVRTAIAQLPAAHRDVILLHWYQGLSFAEISSILLASESAVKVRAHRAYKRLRELLDGTSSSGPVDADPTTIDTTGRARKGAR